MDPYKEAGHVGPLGLEREALLDWWLIKIEKLVVIPFDLER